YWRFRPDSRPTGSRRNMLGDVGFVTRRRVTCMHSLGRACASAPTPRLMTRNFQELPRTRGPKHMNPLTSFLVFVFVGAAFVVGYFVNVYVAVALFACAVLIASSLKMANAWQKFVILRLGKLQSVRGAGLFAIIPVLDTVIAIIVERIQT